MASYRAGQVAEILGVSADTVRRWADDGHFETARSGGGQRLIDGASLARFLAERPDAFEAEGIARSARNRFTGIVTAVRRDGLTAVIEIHTGRHRVVSLITADGADELAVEPGDLAVAVVKATNVIIERPTP